MDEKTVGAIKVVMEATPEGADAAVEAVARTLCTEEDHPG